METRDVDVAVIGAGTAGLNARREIEKAGLTAEVAEGVVQWRLFDKNRFEDNLYEVPHDALAVLGAYGHGAIRTIVFGSKMEKIQSTISNNLLVAGPNYTHGI